jgi:3',5'-cyclic AMP phosphodiesterase CpdA
MLSDIHFNPFADRMIAEKLGAKLNPGCEQPDPALAPMGSDTNYALLRSMLEGVTRAAAQNHLRYDYVIITGDFLAHSFDSLYQQCVGGGNEAYEKFASDTVNFVDGMIAKALPGVPVLAALGNNDTDRGDYQVPSRAFLESVGREWSHGWGKLPEAARQKALAAFARAGDFSAPDPAVANHEFVSLNTSFWSARGAEACGGTDLDPGGQFQWLGEVLRSAQQAGTTATLIMHIPPGIDAMRSLTGGTRTMWTDRCTGEFVAKLTQFRGVVREIYAGHIHRDDFRIVPDQDGRPLTAVHIVPSVSPVYFNNPAVEIGWYDKQSGELKDYATLYLDLSQPRAAWATEYVFSQAYARSQFSLAALEELARALHRGSPDSGVGEKYANYYAVGIRLLVTKENWATYSCAQTEINPSRFNLCRQAAVGATSR